MRGHHRLHPPSHDPATGDGRCVDATIAVDCFVHHGAMAQERDRLEKRFFAPTARPVSCNWRLAIGVSDIRSPAFRRNRMLWFAGRACTVMVHYHSLLKLGDVVVAGLKVVVKQIDVHGMDHEGRVAARSEAILLSKLVHPTILSHFESFEDDVSTKIGGGGAARRTLCIVTEFCSQGDLASHILARKGKLFDEQEVLDMLAQVCLALAYMHSRRVLHRDLKPQNIFVVADGSLRVGDLGIARVLKFTFELAHTVVGTPIYLAPEVVESKPYASKADVWSLGVVLYEMMALKRPFSGSTIPSLVRRILRGKYPPLPDAFSDDLRGLVHLMLSKTPSSRPSVAAILQLPMIRPAILRFVSRCRAIKSALPKEVLPRELRHLLGAPDTDRTAAAAAATACAHAGDAATAGAADFVAASRDGNSGRQSAAVRACRPSSPWERAVDGDPVAGARHDAASKVAPVRTGSLAGGEPAAHPPRGRVTNKHGIQLPLTDSSSPPAAVNITSISERLAPPPPFCEIKAGPDDNEATERAGIHDDRGAVAARPAEPVQNGGSLSSDGHSAAHLSCTAKAFAMAANQAIDEVDAKVAADCKRTAASGAGEGGAKETELGFRSSTGVVHLGGAAETSASTSLRLEAFRVYLGEQLGEHDFLKLYRELQKDDFFDAEMDAEWASALGKTLRGHFREQPERFAFIPLVEQLLRSEAVAFKL